MARAYGLKARKGRCKKWSKGRTRCLKRLKPKTTRRKGRKKAAAKGRCMKWSKGRTRCLKRAKTTRRRRK